MAAYYNEFDPYAAEWLRRLIVMGHIADGEVDERSIEDVTPGDLRGFTQCHFFAGIGVWSHALRRAGWSDDRPVWTGSCPCQPFSAAGKGTGFDDERHLWPAFHWLIAACRPPVVMGEQVASKDGLAWLDLVQADLEGSGYTSGAVDLCAAGVGAPHIRQRLWWIGERLADTSRAVECGRGVQRPGESDSAVLEQGPEQRPERSGVSGGLADTRSNGRGARRHGDHGRDDRPELDPDGGDGGMADTRADGSQGRVSGRSDEERGTVHGSAGRDGADSGLGYSGDAARKRDARGVLAAETGEHGKGFAVDGCVPVGLEHAGASMASRPRPTNGHWRDADWLFCRDGKWRPVEPGTFPLAHGAPARVGRLRAYGNAIVAQAAEEVIRAFMEAR